MFRGKRRCAWKGEAVLLCHIGSNFAGFRTVLAVGESVAADCGGALGVGNCRDVTACCV